MLVFFCKYTHDQTFLRTSFFFPTPLGWSHSVILIEKLKLAQLHNLDEELEEVRRQKQSVTVATETQDE